MYSTDSWVIQESAVQYYRQHMTRLWSFDVKMLPYITKAYNKMLADLIDMLRKSRFIDIEHLMYCHLDDKKIKSIDVIGVQGNIAPNGVSISD